MENPFDVPGPSPREASIVGDEIHTCKICTKSFANKLSKNRHQLYCRKKNFPDRPILRKSCAACRKLKIKCDSSAPNCGRCEEKGVLCIYERTTKSTKDVPNAAGPSRIIDNFPSQPDSSTNPVSVFVDQGSDGQKAPGAQIHFSPSSLGDHEEGPVTQSLSQKQRIRHDHKHIFRSADDIMFSNLLSNYSPSMPDHSFFPAFLGFLPTTNLLIAHMRESPFLNLNEGYSPHYENPSSEVTTSSRTVTSGQPKLRLGSAAIGHNFILMNIKAYAATINTIEDSFVHRAMHEPHLHPDSYTLSQIPQSEHLPVCKTIVQMYNNKTYHTKGFVWRTIGAELRRFMEEYNTADEWSVLSMQQAIVVYIIFRVLDSTGYTTEFDTLLVNAMTSISLKLEETGFLCTAEIEGYRPQWHEWIRVESKRRTIMLMFMIHLLFDIAPTNRVPTLAGFTALPLPASKALWQARSQEEWAIAYDKMLIDRQGRTFLSYADLLNLGRGDEPVSDDPKREDLNRWYTELDGFGIVIMMAATTF